MKDKKFEEFVDKIKANKSIHLEKEYPGEKPYFFKKEYAEKWEKEHEGLYIYSKWRTGGMSGGSCWDTGKEDHHYPTTGDPEPEFEDLDSILAMVCPNITFLQYKKISPAIQREDWTENEYYGNSTNYAVKFISLKDLFDKLQELGLI